MTTPRVFLAALSLTLLITACASSGDGQDDTQARMASASGGTPVLVSMGDSYIAGTAGRWRGNTNGFTNIPQNLDAFGRSDTGENAYDNFGRRFPGEQCFRARSAAIHLGGEWTGVNIACSNARTSSRTDEEGKYKPGIDAGGQLDMLTEIATTDDVKLVAVSIGANDFRFGPVIKNCVTGFLTSFGAFPDRCSEDPEALGTISPDSVARVRSSIARAFTDIITTMRTAGYPDEAWSLISHNYPNPLPPASALRYPESGLSRQIEGGCPFYDADVTWLGGWMNTINDTVAAAAADASAATGKTVVTIDMAQLFEGRRLCEQGTKLIEETGSDAELRASGERVDMIRLTSQIPGSPYDLNEGVHPNNLGQAAIRACLRAAFNNGDARSGTCRPPGDWSAVNGFDEPSVRFSPG